MGAIELDHSDEAATAAANKVDTDKSTKFIASTPSLPPRQPKFSNPNIALLANNDDNNDNIEHNLLCEIPNIVTKQEAESLVYSFDKGLFGKEWSLEGYDRQHRVQRYQCSDNNEGGETFIGKNNNESDKNINNSDDTSSNYSAESSMEESFGWLFDRIVAASSSITTTSDNTNKLSAILKQNRPHEVIVTEHTPSSCRSIVDTFEQFSPCPCRSQNNNMCNCYIANVTLVNSSLYHLEKPQIRDLECWDVTLPVERYSGEMIMEENGVIVKMGDCLWNWRGRIMDVRETSDDDTGDDGDNVQEGFSRPVRKKGAWVRTKKLKALNKRSITVSFRGILPPPPVQQEQEDALVDPQKLAEQRTLASRPLSELLTVIVTTSPIRSNPSTEMLERTFDTFQFAGEEFAFECKKVIVCDGCRVLEEVQQGNSNTDPNAPPKIRIYANGKQNLRNGVATVDQLRNYEEFKAALNKLCEEAREDVNTKSPFRNTQVVELDERNGYGFALRHALRHCVDTPYVCVIQHDRNFMRSTPIKEVVQSIICHPQQTIKYVGMSMKSNLMYFDAFVGKYGKRAMDEFKTLILRPKELRLDANLYGPDGESANQVAGAYIKKDRSKTIQAFRDGYRGSHQNLNHMDWLHSRSGNTIDGTCQLSLTPTLFWYDNTHIVETAHYRDFIFNPKYKMVARGGFVEDKLSPLITRNVERLGLKEGHSRFGCYLLDDHSGMYFTGHLDGGSYKTAHLYDRASEQASQPVDS